MYYDTYRKKRNSRRNEPRQTRRGCGFVLLKLFFTPVLLLALAAGALYILPASFMNIEPENAQLSLATDLPSNRVNILILGLDTLSEDMQRSDAIMVASVGSDGARLISLMRDTMVNLPGFGRHKLNAAYALGGPELVMASVNENFHLNITNYIALDFSGLVDLIDAIGGIELEIEEKELQSLNSYAYNTYRAISKAHPGKYERYASSQAFAAGGQLTLNGLFATGYTRIRYIDSDYVRVSRQRRVFAAIIQRFRKVWWNPLCYVKLWKVATSSINTNLSVPELISLAEKVVIAGDITTSRAPMDEFKRDSGSAIEITDLEGNARAIRSFLYA